MRILVIGINYAPERTSVAPFTTGLCEHLASQGHQVVVITAFPYYPEWRVWDEYRGYCYRREVIKNVKVLRVTHFVPRKPSSLIQRLTYDISFTINAFVVALFTGKCDVIYCSCPPPTVAFAAYLLGKIKRAPYVVKLTDLASDAALATGIMRPGTGMRLARAFEEFTYRKALAVICLCRGFIDRLKARHVDEKHLILISDWGDTENIRPSDDNLTFRVANSLAQDKFFVFHTGNMGKKQCLINVVRAAELSRNEVNVAWVLIGQGEERAHLEQQISCRSLTNIQMLPLQPAEILCHMYSSADILVLNQTAAMEDAVIPSKLLTYMAAGRPVVAAVSDKSEAARQILSAKCGVVIPAENPQALADAVLALQRNPVLRKELGANGRAYAEAHFAKAGVLRAYDDFFRSVSQRLMGVADVLRQEATNGNLDEI